MEARFAFTAQLWGDAAVVCRAIEDHPGPVVEQQFGEFPTWTQAIGCADKLNEGLDLDPLDVRQIVTSSMLATAHVLEQAVKTRLAWGKVETRTRDVQFRFLTAQLNLAICFCASAALMSDRAASRSLSNALLTLQRTKRFLKSYKGPRDVRDIAFLIEHLESTLRGLDPSFLPPSSPLPPNHDDSWPGDTYRSPKEERQAKSRISDSIQILVGSLECGCRFSPPRSPAPAPQSGSPAPAPHSLPPCA